MISKKIKNNLSNSSWIRAMFEEGEKLRKIYGADNVYDFSLGNPDLEPPEEVKESLLKHIDQKGIHGYMSNAGYADVREKVAAKLNAESGTNLSGDNIVMTVGAGGALNVVLKTLLDPGDEVIVFAPFFVEYVFYADNHQGKAVIVPPNPPSFQPDAQVLAKYITPNTKAIIINTPNNPTGIVYSKETLEAMNKVIEEKQKEFGTTIYVLSDEPYRKLAYDGINVPSVHKVFKNSILIDSFSKSLSLPGERIGYIAVNSEIDDISELMAGLIFSNRSLGFVNAPGLFQKVIADALDSKVNVDTYKERRDILYNHLTGLGLECIKPDGAFYLFPKALIDDDVEFVKRAVNYNLLLVPGKGFGCPGYFRISYCVSKKVIENSLPAFERFVKEFK